MVEETLLLNGTIREFMRTSLNVSSYRTRPEQIVLSVLFSVYTVVGISGNSMVLIAVFKIRNWSGLEGAMMCFLTNLALSDFLLCGITFPATAISAAFDRWVLSEAMCWFIGFVCSYLRIVSILLMMWIGVHRALVIKYPFHKKISEKGAKGISLSVWVLATIPQITCFVNISPLHYDPDRAICIASILNDNMLPVAIYALVYLIIPMGTIISVYTLLLCIAVRAVREHSNLTNAGAGSDKRSMSTAHRKAFGTVFAQIGAFLICFLPFVIFVGLTSLDENIVPKRLQVYGACSSSMSAILNPLIYLNTNRTFKKFVLRILKCEEYDHIYTGQSEYVSNTYRNNSAVTYADSKLYPRGQSEIQLTQATPYSSLSIAGRPRPALGKTFQNNAYLSPSPLRYRAHSDTSLNNFTNDYVPVINPKGIFIPVPDQNITGRKIVRSVSESSISDKVIVPMVTDARTPSAVLIVSDDIVLNKSDKVVVVIEDCSKMVKLENCGDLEDTADFPQPRVSRGNLINRNGGE